MGDLPERIWASYSNVFGPMWLSSTDDGAAEYLRADIAAAREADLRAEVNTLATENADYVRELFAVSAERDRHCAEAARLRGLLDEAVAALAPFGTYLATHPFDLDSHGNPVSEDQGCGWVYLTAGQFRRARATLSKLGGQ